MVGRTTYDYTGESAIITGSTRGIGQGIAKGLAEAGANVVVNSRTEEEVNETVAELRQDASGRIIGVPADVANPDGVETLVSTAIDRLGHIDLLMNNAAIWPMEDTMIEATICDWDRTMNVNVRAQFHASKLVAEHMIKNEIEGSIINHTSQTGDRRTGKRGLYGVSKTSINGLTWRMAHELAPYGIRMNAVSTDVTESSQLRYEAELTAEDDSNLDRTTDDVLREWGKQRPSGRLGQPSDIADAVLFLGSDRAEYIVGTILRVSGGGNLQ